VTAEDSVGSRREPERGRTGKSGIRRKKEGEREETENISEKRSELCISLKNR
jgi:hypothetical protein